MLTELRKKLANLASSILNPLLMSVLIVLWLSIESTNSIADAFKWTLLLVAICVLPVYLIAVYYVRSGRLDAIFNNARRQRTRIYLSGCVSASVSIIALLLLGAPKELLAALVAGLVTGVSFMLINLWWLKISIHAAFVTALAVLMIILHGWSAVVVAAAIPLIAWSRTELNQHSRGQVLSGVLLSTLNIVVIFYLFGLI